MTSSVLQTAIKAHDDFVVAHPEQFRLSVPLWRLLAKGKPVAPEELASTSHRPLPEIQAFLHASDVRIDQAGHIIGQGLAFQRECGGLGSSAGRGHGCLPYPGRHLQ